MEEKILEGVTEFCEGLPVSLVEESGEICICARNEAGYRRTLVSLRQLIIALYKNNRSEFIKFIVTTLLTVKD